ncbi:ATP-dependent RNA helicase RhlE [Hyphomonas polymorpha PS728]|uniref:ATP-dependent RNA helicase RhlE n=1 Tax=Hyphomonas polymorpha PS728 TaxID=1280954 RepID=A0A062VM94_9PROT|nr:MULTISPECIES: DEAD/DEAH box helicase [Hyphomonas]KCZ99828.1 ATP-dependent RNA helicase RhlE [Hyphomonas polymorpha PS728]
MSDFQSLGLTGRILTALTKAGYTAPTPIQAQSIPLVIQGRDIVGLAQTGTGKTLAFAAPILDRLSRNAGPAPVRGARVLVLAPTRELAGQIAKSFETYGAGLNLRIVMVCGGAKIGGQIRQLERGAHVLVATPGRLIDLMEQRAVSLDKVDTLILDEADQMLDLGFIHALRAIAKNVPSKRQTLFFSATMPKAVESLAATFLRNPAEVSVTPPATTAGRIEQQICFVEQAEKLSLLVEKIRDPALRSAIVFTRTKHGADGVVKRLAKADIDSVAIHGNKSQAQRQKALDAFKAGRVPILIATDIAARGIHVDGLTHVINYDLPDVPEQFVHRIGRTARAGNSGVAISFCSKDERPTLRAIEKLTGLKLAPGGMSLPDEPLRKPGKPQGNRSGNGGGRGGARSGGHQGGQSSGSQSGGGRPHRKGPPGGGANASGQQSQRSSKGAARPRRFKERADA